MDDDELFKDDDFDLISMLEKTESEYRNSQQQNPNIYDAAHTNTNANTTSTQFQQQQGNSSRHDQDHPIGDTAGNCFTSLKPPEYYGLDVEKQEALLKSALQQAERLRSELAFKNHELVSTKSELRDYKHKLHQQVSKKENVLMDIDPQSPTMSASTQSDHLGRYAPQRTTAFPSIRTHSLKRARTSASPSPSSSVVVSSQRTQTPTRTLVSPPPSHVETEAEIKKRRELEKAAFNEAVANQVGIVKQDMEHNHKMQKTQDGEAFLRWLGTVNFVKLHSERSKTTDIETIILNDLRPTQLTTESDSIFNALAIDLSRCVSQVVSIGVEATLSQILFILRIFIQLCIQEDKVLMFIRATELLYTLATYYQTHVITHLTQEVLGASDQSTLHFLTKGLALIPLENTDERYGKGAYIQGFPDTTNMNYERLKALLHVYSLGTSDTRRILTDVAPSRTQDTVSMILKLLSGLGINGNKMEIKTSGYTKRLLFLLDTKAFTNLISSQKPLATTNEALMIVDALVTDGNTEWLYVEKYRPLLESIYSCLTVPRPHGLLELKWYNIRQTAIHLFSQTMAIVPTPLSPEVAFDLALSSSIYVLNNECLQIKEGYAHPFQEVPKTESDRLLIDTISLMYRTLYIYPILLDYQENDVYFQIVASLSSFQQVMEKSLDLQYEGRIILSKLSDLLNEKRTLMMSQAPELAP